MKMSYPLITDKIFMLISSVIFFISLLSFLYLSPFVGFIFLLSLTLGLLAPFIFFNEQKHVPNLLALFTGPSRSGPQRELPRSCSVCDGETCERQHPSSFPNMSANAHVYFTVPQSVDEALEELLNLVLDNHIYSWYKEISVHDQLADEIRYIIRYAGASLGTRLSKVDLTSVILDRLVPCGVHHLDAYLEGSRRVRGDASVEYSAIQYLASEGGLHVALTSREEECNYLRGVVRALFPYLIPVQYQKSNMAKIFLQELLGQLLLLQGMDLLADPDTVNFLFLLLLEEKDPTPWAPALPEPSVLFLKSFSSVNTHPRSSVLRCNLSTILNDQDLLFDLQSFLKTEGGINILGFCLAVEDFNRQIFNPDLTPDQLQTLHKDALELYHNYMAPTARDKINFQPEIVSQIREIIRSDACDIVKLRTTRPLFQAYEYVFNLLEREYLPLFMNSDAYFKHICGLKSSQAVQKTSNRHRRTDSSTSASFSPFKSKVAKAQTEDGTGARSALEGLSHAFRDLTAWRVSIPRVEEKVDAVTRKMEYVFIVDVTRIDVSGDKEELNWEVERRYHEFYVLEAKLTEFHGEFVDNVLPPKKLLYSKGVASVNSTREIFEQFLQKLLQKPCLKNSQLLFLFFKSKDEFTASYLPDVSLGRFLKEVPRKLIKERGQNLDAFISSFIASTSHKTLRTSPFEVEGLLKDAESQPILPLPENQALREGLYGDNAKSVRSPALTLPPASPLPQMNIKGIVETVLFIAVRLYGLSLSCLQWAMCLKVLMGNTIDAAVAWFLRKKLAECLAAPRLVKLIQLIRDVLFFDPPPPRLQADRLAREREIREKVVNLIPKWTQRYFFTPHLYLEGASTLVNLFQQPVLNKQLSYTLLDIVLEELFPELKQDYEEDSKFLRH